VQAWNGPRDIEPEQPTITIDGEIIAGGAHAV
jgi:hypothetical protein